MANSIAAVKNFTTILDEVYQRSAVSRCLKSHPISIHDEFKCTVKQRHEASLGNITPTAFNNPNARHRKRKPSSRWADENRPTRTALLINMPIFEKLQASEAQSTPPFAASSRIQFAIVGTISF